MTTNNHIREGPTAMDSEIVSSMYAQIVNGVTKEDCPGVTDDESSRMYDIITKEVAAARAKGYHFDMVNP